MDAPRFQIRTLLVLLGIAAFMFTALAKPSEWMQSAISLITMFALYCSLAFVVSLSGRKRAFSAGFAALGFGFRLSTRDFSFAAPGITVMERVLIWLWGFMPAGADYETFVLTFRDLWSLTLALVGGFFCRWVYDRHASPPQ